MSSKVLIIGSDDQSGKIAKLVAEHGGDKEIVVINKDDISSLDELKERGIVITERPRLPEIKVPEIPVITLYSHPETRRERRKNERNGKLKNQRKRIR